jgi:hypothetical protein
MELTRWLAWMQFQHELNQAQSGKGNPMTRGLQ